MKMSVETGASSSDDDAAWANQEALAAVRGLPLAERLALMASGALHDTEGAGGVAGTSRRRRRMAGAGVQGGHAAAGKGENGAGKVKPKNKHAPTELSSKKPVSRLGAVGAGAAPPTGSGKRRKARGKWLLCMVDVGRYCLQCLIVDLIVDVDDTRTSASTDPRFDPALGKVNYDAFRQAYGFLEGYQEKELQALQVCSVRSPICIRMAYVWLWGCSVPNISESVTCPEHKQHTHAQAAMKKAKSHTKKAELKTAMNAIKQERSERQRADRTRALLRGAKREERGKVAAGKAPFFLKVMNGSCAGSGGMRLDDGLLSCRMGVLSGSQTFIDRPTHTHPTRTPRTETRQAAAGAGGPLRAVRQGREARESAQQETPPQRRQRPSLAPALPSDGRWRRWVGGWWWWGWRGPRMDVENGRRRLGEVQSKCGEMEGRLRFALLLSFMALSTPLIHPYVYMVK